MIKKYIDRNTRITTNFKAGEFASKDGATDIYIDDELVKLLQDIREHFKAPVTVNSAYRTPLHNSNIKGEKDSKHMCGIAADIAVSGVSPQKVYNYCVSLFPKVIDGVARYGGVGLYPTFVHIDIRPAKSRWTGK